MQRFSIFSLLRNAFRYQADWQRMWRSPEPKRRYDIVIIGGGGHGLGAAYFLAKEHGIRNVAVLDKGWLGGGNTARNTMHVYGAKYELIDVEEIKRRLPIFRPPPRPRLEVLGGVHQPEAMMARHDAVAWGFARMADAHGVDIIQNCEVTGIRRDGGRVTGVETTRGVIKAGKVGMAVAGHGAVVAAMAGIRLPIEVQPLQAWVSEPVKPVLHEILVFSGYGCYMMQSDKGELVIGGPTDPYPSYAQRGTFRTIEQVTSAVLEMFPIFARMKLLRHWAGMLDIVYDGSPVISKTPLGNFYVDIAGAGGFKTTPMAARMHAWLIAKDEPHELIRDFGLDRFERGRLVVEGGVSFNR